MATFTVIGIVVAEELLLAAVIPGAVAIDTADVGDADAQPWHGVVEASSVRHAETAARFFHNHDIVLDTVTSCELALNSVVVDGSGTVRSVLALRRRDQQVEVWFESDLDFPLDTECPDHAYAPGASVLVLPAGASIPLGY